MFLQLKDPSKGVDAAQKTVDLVKKFKGEEVTEAKLEDAKPEDPKRYDQVCIQSVVSTFLTKLQTNITSQCGTRTLTLLQLTGCSTPFMIGILVMIGFLVNHYFTHLDNQPSTCVAGKHFRQ